MSKGNRGNGRHGQNLSGPNRYRAIPIGDGKIRSCLCCNRDFKSKGPGNRFCIQCSSSKGEGNFGERDATKNARKASDTKGLVPVLMPMDIYATPEQFAVLGDNLPLKIREAAIVEGMHRVVIEFGWEQAFRDECRALGIVIKET